MARRALIFILLFIAPAFCVSRYTSVITHDSSYAIQGARAGRSWTDSVNKSDSVYCRSFYNGTTLLNKALLTKAYGNIGLMGDTLNGTFRIDTTGVHIRSFRNSDGRLLGGTDFIFDDYDQGADIMDLLADSGTLAYTFNSFAKQNFLTSCMPDFAVWTGIDPAHTAYELEPSLDFLYDSVLHRGGVAIGFPRLTFSGAHLNAITEIASGMGFRPELLLDTSTLSTVPVEGAIEFPLSKKRFWGTVDTNGSPRRLAFEMQHDNALYIENPGTHSPITTIDSNGIFTRFSVPNSYPQYFHVFDSSLAFPTIEVSGLQASKIQLFTGYNGNVISLYGVTTALTQNNRCWGTWWDSTNYLGMPGLAISTYEASSRAVAALDFQKIGADDYVPIRIGGNRLYPTLYDGAFDFYGRHFVGVGNTDTGLARRAFVQQGDTVFSPLVSADSLQFTSAGGVDLQTSFFHTNYLTGYNGLGVDSFFFEKAKGGLLWCPNNGFRGVEFTTTYNASPTASITFGPNSNRPPMQFTGKGDYATADGSFWFDSMNLKFIPYNFGGRIRRVLTSDDSVFSMCSLNVHQSLVVHQYPGQGVTLTDSAWALNAQVDAMLHTYDAQIVGGRVGGGHFDLVPEYGEWYLDTSGLTRVFPTKNIFYGFVGLAHDQYFSQDVEPLLDTSGVRMIFLAGPNPSVNSDASGIYRISYNISCKLSNTDTLHIHFYKNNNEIPDVSSRQYFNSAADLQSQSASGLCSFAVYDTLSLRGSCTTDNTTLTISHFNMAINRIGPESAH